MRHLLAIGPALLLAMFIIGHDTIAKAIPGYSSDLSQSVRYLLLAWGLLAAVYFLIDAFRRQYRGSRTVAYALAIVGLISFGLTSLLYYAIWGRQPIDHATDIYGHEFCPRCFSTTASASIPAAVTLNTILGTRYMGTSEKCESCKSVVRTAWFWFLLPLFPLGSYRFISIDPSAFIARKTHLRWKQVLPIYGITIGLAGIAVAVSVISHR